MLGHCTFKGLALISGPSLYHLVQPTTYPSCCDLGLKMWTQVRVRARQISSQRDKIRDLRLTIGSLLLFRFHGNLYMTVL